MHRQVMIPATGTNGTNGVLKARCTSGIVFLTTSTPAQTSEKGSDTGHFTCQACRNESRQQTDEYHKQQIAAGGCSELFIDMRKERR